MTPPTLGFDFGDEALSEFTEHVSHYNAKRERLGEEFADLVLQKVEAVIAKSPLAFARHPKAPSLRVYSLSRFPFRIIYSVEDDVVVVVAIEHMRAQPDQWRGRLIDPDEG